jgi:hypothetical protein
MFRDTETKAGLHQHLPTLQGSRQNYLHIIVRGQTHKVQSEVRCQACPQELIEAIHQVNSREPNVQCSAGKKRFVENTGHEGLITPIQIAKRTGCAKSSPWWDSAQLVDLSAVKHKSEPLVFLTDREDSNSSSTIFSEHKTLGGKEFVNERPHHFGLL